MTRHLFLSSLVLVSLVSAASIARGQAAGPDLENSKHQFLGQINGNAVQVRSGPSDNDYATMRLDKGTQVTVVGLKFNWLKIAPPDGSFSYVSKLYIERYGDGSMGKTTKDNLSVWAGSKLTTVKSALQCRLPRGADVAILGEADEYYMIKPPAEAFVWVSQNLVTPVKLLTPVAGGTGTGSGTGVGDPGIIRTINPDPLAGLPSTLPTTGPAIAGVPTTQVSEMVAAAEAAFDKAEADYKEAQAKPLEDQPIADLQAAYVKVLADDALPPSMRRVAESRAATLTQRADSKEKLLAVRKSQAEAAARLVALKAEREELEARMAAQAVSIFTAVGQLQASSLQGGAGTLYRLTDPANGRTCIYVRTTDPKFATLLGQFVGVHGEIAQDQQMNLKAVTATDVMSVDPAKIHKGIAAQVVPPSLLQKPAQAAVEPSVP